MTSSRVLRDDDRGWTPQLWGILFVLGGALCLDALDVSMVGVALPSIRSALGLSTSSLQWIVSGYVLGYGGLLLLGGRAADLLGRRRVFLVALAVFALVSAFGGLVSSPGLLIAARFVKGAAAAFTAPASMSLLTTTFPEGPMRNRAFSIYTVFGASGFSLGLVLSGALTEISWRWTLLVPAPVALGVLAAAIWLIPSGERSGRGERRFDIPGAVTITAAMLLLVYTVVSAQQAGWGSVRTVGSFTAVAVLVWVFAAIERRSRDPLVPFAIFSSAGLRRANIGAVTLFGTYISFQFLTTQYLQTLSGWSAMSTALAFLPAGVMVVVLSTRMGSLLGRFGPTPLTGLAFTCLVLAYAVFLRAGVHPDYPAVMLPATLLVGLAFGLGFSSLTVAATAGVPNSEQGLAASLFQTSFQVGGGRSASHRHGGGRRRRSRPPRFCFGDAGCLSAGAGPDHRHRGARDAGRAERAAQPAGPAGGVAWRPEDRRPDGYRPGGQRRPDGYRPGGQRRPDGYRPEGRSGDRRPSR
jgi:MFS family permease